MRCRRTRACASTTSTTGSAATTGPGRPGPSPTARSSWKIGRSRSTSSASRITISSSSIPNYPHRRRAQHEDDMACRDHRGRRGSGVRAVGRRRGQVQGLPQLPRGGHEEDGTLLQGHRREAQERQGRALRRRDQVRGRLRALAVERPASMKLAKYVKFREEKFGGVLFETRSEKVFTLNPTATAVVREIQAGSGEGDIPARLKARYRDESGAIEREAQAFIAELRQKGLVED